MDEHSLYCFEIAEEIGVSEHCPICHGDNLYNDEVMTEEKLVDGRMVEICCLVKQKLIKLNLLISAEKEPEGRRCFLIYKSQMCGYIGEEEDCSKTFHRCCELKNEKRFSK